MESCETRVLKKPDAAREGTKNYRAITLASVMSKWYASRVRVRPEKEKEPESEECAHGLRTRQAANTQKVLTTNLLPKHCEWQDVRNSVMKHGTVVRPTMSLASSDIQTSFDEAKPKHVMTKHTGERCRDHKSVESPFSFNRCLRQGSELK